MRKKDIFLLLFSALTVGSFYMVYGQYKVDKLAKCLADKGAVMYGAKWCEHCNAQKISFGKSFDKIDYFECAKIETLPQLQECFAMNIKKYPTWVFSNGIRREGFQTLQSIDQASECNIGL
jgi:thiol-disulfide isomerase/thioredoxin